MSNNLEVFGMCRICMKTNPPNVKLQNSLFSDREVSSKIIDALEKVMGCEVPTSDSLPNVICLVCLYHLQIAHELRITFEETSKKLKQSTVPIDIIDEKFEIHEEELIVEIPEDNEQTHQNGEPSENIDVDTSESEEMDDNEIMFAQSVSDNDTDNESSEINTIEQHQCNICDFKTVNILNLQRHVEQIHPSIEEHPIQSGSATIHQCPICNYQAISMLKLEDHTKSKHTKSYSCSLCTYVANSPKLLEIHEFNNHQSINKSRYLKCDFCDYRTYEAFSLKLHNDRKHKEAQTYKCNECPQMAYSKHHHIEHMFKHSSILQCNICDFQGTNAFAFTLHQKLHENQSVDQRSILEKMLTMPLLTDSSNQNDVQNIQKVVYSDKETLNSEANNDVILISDDETLKVKHKSRNKSSRKKKCSTDRGIKQKSTKSTNIKQLYECGICKFNSNSYTSFHQHGKSCHPILAKMSCHICTYKTFSKQFLDYHVKNVHMHYILEPNI